MENEITVERQITQQTNIAVIHEQITNLKASSDKNTAALYGTAGGYIGLVGEVAMLGKNMTTMMDYIDEIKKSVKVIENVSPCETCELNEIVSSVKILKEKENEYPNLLWLIRYKPKQTIPWIIITIVTVSALGHIQFEPVFTAIMVALGMSPLAIAAFVKIFK